MYEKNTFKTSTDSVMALERWKWVSNIRSRQMDVSHAFALGKVNVILYPHLWQMQIFRSFLYHVFVYSMKIYIYFCPVLRFSFLCAIKISLSKPYVTRSQNGAGSGRQLRVGSARRAVEMGKQIQRDFAQIEACSYIATSILKMRKEEREALLRRSGFSGKAATKHLLNSYI